MVKLCAGHHPKLYSYQNTLPRMPVPNLSDTCKGLLRSVKPILEEDEYRKMEALAKVGLHISNRCTVEIKPSENFNLLLGWLVCEQSFINFFSLAHFICSCMYMYKHIY